MDRAENIIAVVCKKILPMLNEYQQRILAGCLAEGYGHGGKMMVSRHCSLSRNNDGQSALLTVAEHGSQRGKELFKNNLCKVKGKDTPYNSNHHEMNSLPY